mgnify:CR=1 FL=1
MAGNTQIACTRVGSFAAFLGICLLLTGYTLPVHSQDSSAGPKRTLYLLLQTPPDQTEEVILQTIQKGIQTARLQIRGEPIIYTVSPAFMEEIQRLIQGGRWQVQAADDAQDTNAKGSTFTSAEGKVFIRTMSAAENIYEIQLPSSKHILKEMTVDYGNGKVKKYRVASPQDKQPSALDFRYPGSYVFRPDGKEIPKKCTLQLIDQKSGEHSVSVDWPVQSKTYLIILPDFVGNINELFAVVQDPNRVANPIQLQSLDQHLFAIASVGLEAEESSLIRGNNLTVAVPDLRTRNVRHVWVYFPLKEEDIDKEIERWTKHSDIKNISVDLPLLIERELVRYDATELARIDKETINQPKWWETRRAGNMFTRQFILADLPELVERMSSMWMLAVWVFEDLQGRKELIFVKDRVGKTVAMLPDEIITWRRSLPILKKNKK